MFVEDELVPGRVSGLLGLCLTVLLIVGELTRYVSCERGVC
jgi:hypothetical protein